MTRKKIGNYFFLTNLKKVGQLNRYQFYKLQCPFFPDIFLWNWSFFLKGFYKILTTKPWIWLNFSTPISKVPFPHSFNPSLSKQKLFTPQTQLGKLENVWESYLILKLFRKLLIHLPLWKKTFYREEIILSCSAYGD